MGTSRSVEQMAGKCFESAAKLKKGRVDAIRQGAAVAKVVIEASVMIGAPSLRLSHVGWSKKKKTHAGARLGVRTKVTAGTTPSALLESKGPIWLIEADTAGHLIGAGRGQRKRNAVANYAKAGFLYAPGAAHPVRGPVYHPGTKGKHLYEAGIAAAHGPVTKTVRTRMALAPMEVFR